MTQPALNIIKKAAGALFLIGFLSTASLMIYQHSAHATLVGFDPGNIMTDDVMSNKNTMSERQIQSFLDSKNACNKSAIGALSWYNNKDQNKATEGRLDTIRKRDNKKISFYFNLKNGKFVCMAKESFGGESAARIIWKAAQDYRINPQVILVLLQKEQGLITDLWPNKSHQYAAATGYNCPDDGGGCRSGNAGFKKQIREASALFRTVLNGGWSNYPVGKNYVQYHPSASCGKSLVHIKNRATSALYRYTPYQPNKGALAAGWGEASCGAYGNRNFYNYFTTWFGSTRDPLQTSFENLVGKSGVIKNNSVAVGSATETVTFGKNIYTFYFDQTAKNLRVSRWNGSEWNDRVLDGIGAPTSGAIQAELNVTEIFGFTHNNSLQVYYYDAISKSLRHIFIRNGVMKVETLDGTANSILKKDRDVGSSISGMTYGSNNGIQLYYYNADDKSIEHTWWDPRKSKWSTETLDGTANSILKKDRDVGSSISGVVYNGGIQLFYYNSVTGELEHTWWNNTTSKWGTERMDGDTNTVLGNYINAGKKIDTAVFQNRLFVAYYDDASVLPGDKISSWRLAYWSGVSWIPSTLEGGTIGLSNPDKSMPPGDITLAPQANSSLQIFYRGADDQLRHVWMRK